ncbi:prepilin-type N-terminal cleavage/methylation domain-containing protein, partial [Candidatus Avelusimicrobium alvi]
MKKTQGFGLIGMLIAVLIVGILMAAILKRYAGQTRQMMSVPGLTQPAASSQT